MPRLGRVWAKGSVEARPAGVLPPPQGRRSRPPERPCRGRRSVTRVTGVTGLTARAPDVTGVAGGGLTARAVTGVTGDSHFPFKWRCPATVRSTTSRWMSEMLHPRDARVDFLYYHWRWNLMQRSWSHLDCQWSNWCTRSLQGVLRIYSDSFFF